MSIVISLNRVQECEVLAILLLNIESIRLCCATSVPGLAHIHHLDRDSRI